MANKSTKRTLTSSVLALALCFAMLLGTTFAWFTDSATSKGNVIKTGSFGIELNVWNGTNYEPVDSAPIINAVNWEPGTTEVVYLSIANVGTLDLKYKVALSVYETLSNLHEVMEYAITPDATPSNPVTSWTNGIGVIPGVNQTAANNVPLQAGATHYFALSIHMDDNAGNGYENGQIMFDINVLAAQLASEEDSFGSEYDKDATYFIVSDAVTIPDNATEETVLTSKNPAKAVKVEIPANIVNGIDDGVESIMLSHTEPEIDVVNKTVNFDTIEILDQNGNAIDLTQNTTPIQITLPAQTVFAAGESVDIYHDGVLVDTVIVNDDQTITYEANHFCEVTVKQNVRVPEGNVTAAYLSGNSVWGEWSGNAINSFVIKIYSDDTYLGSTSLNNIGGIIDGDVNVTWHLYLDTVANADEYWTQEWTVAPTKDLLPTTAALFIDGVKVGESSIQFNGPDDLNKIVAAVADDNGAILAFFTSLQDAMMYSFTAGGEVIMLENIDLNN